MSKAEFYDCSQHDGDSAQCGKIPICRHIGQKCECNSDVSRISNPQRCTCKSRFQPNEDYTECAKICPAGQKRNGSNSCVPCEAGTWSEAGAESCTACSGSTPVANPGHTECITATICNAMGNAQVSNNNQCNCASNYKYDVYTNKCISSCAAGLYMDTNGDCIECDNGTYSNYGATSCIQCEGNLVVNFSKTGCVSADNCGGDFVVVRGQCSCKAGSYRNGDECRKCNGGQISTAGSTQCTSCQNSNNQGLISSPDHTKCINSQQCEKISGAQSNTFLYSCQCNPVDYELNEQGNKCVNPCHAGTYFVTGSGCLPCNGGTWSGESVTECQTCIAPASLSNPGQTGCISKEQCVAIKGSAIANSWCGCGHGYEVSADKTSCVRCPPGYASGDVGVNCAGCFGGFVADLTQTICIQPQDCGDNTELKGNQCVCKAGYGYDADYEGCVQCAAGTHGPSADGTCDKCPEGQVSQGGTTACTACPGGQEPNEGQTGCAPSSKTPTQPVGIIVAASVSVILMLLIVSILVAVLVTRRRKRNALVKKKPGKVPQRALLAEQSV